MASPPIIVTTAKISDLLPYANNAREHTDEQVAQVAASIKEFGWTNPIIVHGSTVVAGHARLAAARKLNLTEVPIIDRSDMSEAQWKAYVLADNQLAQNATWNEGMLSLELDYLTELDFDLDLIGFPDLDALMDDEGAADNDIASGSLAEEFIAPPFSVLDARQGWWQERKRAWIGTGIRSEVGRGIAPTMIDDAEYKRGRGGAGNNEGGSIFDPVLCELVYRWFSPEAGQVIDPFAGGSVRGVVASKLGLNYWGSDLSGEQLEANRAQAADICDTPFPEWHHGDSMDIAEAYSGEPADFIFSCPPYADLEVYSKDPRDLSSMSYKNFIAAYSQIIKRSTALLKEDRFACFVVGEVRDGKGNYYGFVKDTIQAFSDAGLYFYNDAVLITPVGTMPIKARRQFNAGRKLVKGHQNILIFLKGDAKKATAACGEVEVELPDGMEGVEHGN